jgi:hypothetical protein
MATVILLVPGFFGYSAFGPDSAPVLEYFAGVRQVLEPLLPGRAILVHEPPPTGSLDDRARSLFDALGKLQQGKKLAHAPRAVRASKVHIVGHSTGGLDARLVANPSYVWPAGPSAPERAAVLSLLGNIVTVAAPFWGTPLVDHAGWARDALLASVHALTLLGTLRDGRLDVFFLRLLTGFAASPTPVRPLRMAQAHLVAATARRAASSRTKSGADAALVAHQVQRFLHEIDSDRRLFGDLSPTHLAAVNAEISATDPRIVSYVTVSPRPSVFDVSVNVPALLIYRLLWSMTAHDSVGGWLPAGPPIGPAARIHAEVVNDRSSDGVIPTRSQTLGGVAEGIVLGDHLDVTGSFPGGTGADVMRSGAGFRGPRFAAFWTDVARHLH